MRGAVTVRGDVSIVLITGCPGGGKTELARRLSWHLPSEWRVLRLDDFFGPWGLIGGGIPNPPNLWPTVLARPDVPGRTVSFYVNEGAKVVVEGIIPGDMWADLICKFGGASLTSPSVRILDLHCTKQEAILRMTKRPLKPKGAFDPGAQYDYLRPLSTVSVARRIVTDGMSEDEVLDQAVKVINQDP